METAGAPCGKICVSQTVPRRSFPLNRVFFVFPLLSRGTAAAAVQVPLHDIVHGLLGIFARILTLDVTISKVMNITQISTVVYTRIRTGAGGLS